MSQSDYQALFLKYRPQKLSDILAQNSVKETLINAIKNKKVAQAYLLVGPRGAGKTSTARIIAKSLNCLNPDDGQSPTTEPCGTCENCTSIANSNSIDVIEIDAASHNSVDDARDLVQRVNLASMSGKYKVYIIDEVHMLSRQAFNALLKVIEEPPSNVVFILATTEVDAVPKTISSRCQQLRFKPIGADDCLARLKHVSKVENINIEDSALELISQKADGAMRDALSLLDQISVFSNENSAINSESVLDVLGSISQEEIAKLVKEIIERNSRELINEVENLINTGKDPRIIIQDLINYLLRILELKSTQQQNSSQYENSSLECIKQNQTENYELVQIIESLSELETKLKRGTSSKNLLKAWLLKITHRADMLIVKELSAKLKSLEEAKLTGQTRTEPEYKTSNKVNKVETVEISKNEALKPSPTEGSNTNSFLDHLSPSTKGMYISSQAHLLSVNNGEAKIQIPIQFKFLKSKLEARSDEIKLALSKFNSDQIKSLNIEIVEQIKQAVFVPKQEAQSKSSFSSQDDIKLDEIVKTGINVFGGQEIK